MVIPRPRPLGIMYHSSQYWRAQSLGQVGQHPDWLSGVDLVLGGGGQRQYAFLFDTRDGCSQPCWRDCAGPRFFLRQQGTRQAYFGSRENPRHLSPTRNAMAMFRCEDYKSGGLLSRPPSPPEEEEG